MALVFITGSTDGLGCAAAQSLLQNGHQVVLHARSKDRAASLGELASRVFGIVLGDLCSAAQTRSIADQVNGIGRMDAVIHNAGVYMEESRGPSPEGHAGVLAVNTLAPYVLTALIHRPDRLVYLSSGLHRGGEGSLRTSIGRNGVGMAQRPMPRASYRWPRWHSQWRATGRMP